MMQKIEINTLELLKDIKISEIKRNKSGLYIKVKWTPWCRIPEKMIIDSNFIEGVAYYIGDGRTKTKKGLSIIDVDDSAIEFFVIWLQKYFQAKKDNIKIKSNDHYKEASINRTILKKIYDSIKPIVIKLCLNNKEFASAYLRGIMAAEGSPKYHGSSGSRQVHLKMRNKSEIEYIHSLLKNLEIKSNILYSKSDNEWLVGICGVYELQKLKEIDIFKLTKSKKYKFDYMMSAYKRKQTKIGQVAPYYINKLIEFKETGEEITAPKLAKFIGRHRTRVVNVLRMLQKEGFIDAKRIKKTGRPFVFEINSKGKKLLDSFSKGF